MGVSPEAFLRAVWRKQHDGCVFLPYMYTWKPKRWRPGKVHRPDDFKLPTDKDVYFTPNTFSEPIRSEDYCQPGRWLYADLDEVSPHGISLKPTAAWETSPGRYQAMWLLAGYLRPSVLRDLNRALTVTLGADKGGFDLSQVLRVPGTVHRKQEARPHVVRLLWFSRRCYPTREVRALSRREAGTGGGGGGGGTPLVANIPEEPVKEILRRHWSRLPIRAKELLRSKDEDDRSARMYELELLLIEHGLTKEETWKVVWALPWNKFKQRRTGKRQVWVEVCKAAEEVQPPSRRRRREASAKAIAERNGTGPTPVALTDFLSNEVRKPMWMVEGVWSEDAHGVLVGPPKTYKSVLATDLAVSVASGTRFLNYFTVPPDQVGPVLMVQKENPEGEVQDRFYRICYSRGLMGSVHTNGARAIRYEPPNVPPVAVVNNPDVDLATGEGIEQLEAWIREWHAKLLILDPLYLLAPTVDENSAREMTPVLENLLKIKQRYACGTLLIHHFKKQNAEHPTHGPERISGTGVFHRWYESALLLEHAGDSANTVRISPEHRGHAQGGSIEVTFDLGSSEDAHYHAQVRSPRAERRAQYETIEEVLSVNPDGVTVPRLSRLLGISHNGVRRRAARMNLTVSTTVSETSGRQVSTVMGKDQWKELMK